MPLPIIADTYRTALEWIGPGGLRAATVLHFTAAASDAAGVFADIDASVTTQMWNHAPSTVSVTRVVITKLDGSSASGIFSPAGAKWAGASAAGDLLVAGAVLVSHRTALRGPARRGRSFLPFPTEGNVSNGILTGAVVTAMSTAWNNFRVAVATAGSPLVVASYKVGAASATAVTSCVAEAALGTIRGRQERLR